MSVLPACKSLHHRYDWCLQRAEEGITSSGTGVTDSWEPPCGYWKSNLCPLEEQPFLLTSDSSCQPLFYFIF